ncbi:MAG TPA: hypothetical protein VMI10_13605 [Terriglobales bacterium]|nr:hypothetical protein [Terriglobales bacterium]
MFTRFAKCCKFLHKFRGYEPQPVTPITLYRWLRQFEADERDVAVALLDHVIFYNKQRLIKALVNQNAALLDRLKLDGIPIERVIYVHIDEPGSSSSIMINLLRNKANLERLGWNILDASNPKRIVDLIVKLKQVAIVYVDDFLGSGIQFCQSRDFVSGLFPTSVPEFLLAPCVCEEAYGALSKRDVEVCADHIHSKSERPLHPSSFIFDKSSKKRFQQISAGIDVNSGMGFFGMAVMVAMYHNAPDNMPLVLRGNEGQDRFRGILPRTTDLPIPANSHGA